MLQCIISLVVWFCVSQALYSQLLAQYIGILTKSTPLMINGLRRNDQFSYLSKPVQLEIEVFYASIATKVAFICQSSAEVRSKLDTSGSTKVFIQLFILFVLPKTCCKQTFLFYLLFYLLLGSTCTHALKRCYTNKLAQLKSVEVPFKFKVDFDFRAE